MGFFQRLFGRRPTPDLQEWSTNFDASDVGPFLHRIAPHFSRGFGVAEVEQVVRLVASTEHDETSALEFEVEYGGKAFVMQVVVFMDDVDSPDIYLGVPAILAEVLSVELDKFSEERGSETHA